MKEILFATGNKAKLDQFQFVSDNSDFPARIVSLYDQHPDVSSYDEEYATQEQIVEEGAREIYKQIQKPIVVEDSIIEVDALGGKPGLRSNDFLKEHGRGGLLEKLEKAENRSAHIISIVGYFNGTVLVSFKTVIEGIIAREESYKEGEPGLVGPTEYPFGGGYNAIFIRNDTGKTIADNTAKEGLTLGYREPNFYALLKYLHNT